MKTYTITFSKENIEDLHHVLLIYETDCLIEDNYIMYDAIKKIRKYIEEKANL